MKLWKENRINQEWELSNQEVAKQFIASEYYKKRYEEYRGTEHALIFFISAKDGLNSSWEWEQGKGSIDGSKDMIKILKMIKEE